MKLNTTIVMGLIALATISFTACGDSKKTDEAAPATTEATTASVSTGPVVRVIDGNGTPIAQAGITIIITSSDNSVIKLKTGDDGTVALPTDRVKYPATFTAESEGHSYSTRQIPSAASIVGNKVVLLRE